MEVWLNPNGTRDRSFRPYIQEEETSKSIYPYHPDIPFNYGMYDTVQNTCGSWQDLYCQYRKIGNYIYRVDSHGNLISVRPDCKNNCPDGKYHQLDPKEWWQQDVFYTNRYI